MNFTYDMNSVRKLLNDFYVLTKIKIVLYDYNFNVIATVPENDCSFCAAMKANPDALSRCDACTVEGFTLCKKRNMLNIYKCHAGLIESVTPVRINGVIVGYMIFGQVLEDRDKETKAKEIIEYAQRYADGKIQEHFNKLVTKRYSEIQSASAIMESCVCYLLMKEVIKETSGNIAFRISEYINENLSGDLSVDVLCKKFMISRNKLYKIAETYYGVPIAQFIRAKRLEKAEQLIKEGYPVTSVAESVGFSDYGYFGKAYKKHIGITPMESRILYKQQIHRST